MAQMYGKEKDSEKDTTGSILELLLPATDTHKSTLADNLTDPGFISFFNALPKKSPETGTLRLFLRTGSDSYYAAYGPDALFVAQHVFHTNTVIKYLGGGGPSSRLPSVILKTTVAHVLLREALTSKQLRIEIWAPEPGQGKKCVKFRLDKEVGKLRPWLYALYLRIWTLSFRHPLGTCNRSKTCFLLTRTSALPQLLWP